MLDVEEGEHLGYGFKCLSIFSCSTTAAKDCVADLYQDQGYITTPSIWSFEHIFNIIYVSFFWTDLLLVTRYMLIVICTNGLICMRNVMESLSAYKG